MRKLFDSQFRVTQAFGVNAAYYKQFNLRAHEGVDIIPTGNSRLIFSLEDGIVVKDDDIAGNPRTDAYGINITIWSPKIKKAFQYCHLVVNYFALGDEVKKGDPVGVMGGTGNVQGDHLHLNMFEVDEEGYRKNRDNGYNGGVDPLPFLQQDDAPVIITSSMPTDPDPGYITSPNEVNDIYRALCGVDASQDEKDYRISQHINRYDLIRVILNGDDRAIKQWREDINLANLPNNQLITELERRLG